MPSKDANNIKVTGDFHCVPIRAPNMEVVVNIGTQLDECNDRW